MYLHDVIVDPQAVDGELTRIEGMWNVACDEPLKAATSKIEIWATSITDGKMDKVDVVLFDQADRELARCEIPGY